MPPQRETDATRLLRALREREATSKLLDAHALKALRGSLPGVQSTVELLKQPLFQDTLRTVQDGSALKAIDVARQLALASPAGSGPSKNSPSTAVAAGSVVVRTVSDLGAMIRKGRKAMKLNQAAFAAHAGVGRRFISELESGKSTLEFDKVVACAQAAGIDLSARSRTA